MYDQAEQDEVVAATILPDAEIVEASVAPPPVIVDASVVEEPRTSRSAISAVIHVLGSAWELLFGLLSLVVGLAVIATIPIVQLLSLGYLLEVVGRIVRTRRVTAGFVGVRKAARVGTIVLGTWLVMFPVTIISSFWRSARLIDPASRETQVWEVFLIVATILATAHILWAWCRGGRLRHFLWPAPLKFIRWLREPRKWANARDGLWDFVMSLRLGYYFRLGLVGFLGTIAWLFVPVVLYLAATDVGSGVGVLYGIAGGLAFAIAVFHLPALQAEFAATGNWRKMFDIRAVWRDWYRAPLAMLVMLVLTLAFALPLYLLKIELTPRQVTYIPSLVFVLFALPSRLVQGWAVARAVKKDGITRRWWRTMIFVPCVFAASLACGMYAFISFFTKYTSWYGSWSLLEQHAFLVPVPFLGLGN